MKYLPDRVIAHLQNEIQTPDFSGTRYRAVKLLGSGGMAEVWLAEDNVLHRTVALKVLTAENGVGNLFARLLQEAVVLARLEHPGIVPIHDAGSLPDGRTFYCMKYIQGQTLDQHMAALSLRQRLHLLQRIADPLGFAHSRGIIHRDLKPSNIMVGAFGEVLIVDWGLAKVATEPPLAGSASVRDEGRPEFAPGSAPPPANIRSTEHGTVLGTPGYMAPEQARGAVALVDPRTDVFGLGAILRFMITGDSYSKESAARRRLQAICRKATAPEIADRYSSVSEMASDIGCYLDDLPVRAYQENIFERIGRLLSRNRVAVVLVFAYLLMRLLFILFSRR
jgi:eukaryotic-like serine/threonine-protein kinase